MKILISFSLLLLSACGKGAPIQPYCPGPADDMSQIHYFGDSITYGGGNTVNGAPFGYPSVAGFSIRLENGPNTFPSTFANLYACTTARRITSKGH